MNKEKRQNVIFNKVLEVPGNNRRVKIKVIFTVSYFKFEKGQVI